MSVLKLSAKRKIALEDSIRKTLPELPVYAGPITIGQLLHYTSGLRDYLTPGDLAGYIHRTDLHSARHGLDAISA